MAGQQIVTKNDIIDGDQLVNRNELGTIASRDADEFVQSVEGKGLSTNDYSDADKLRLANTSGTNTGDQDISNFVVKESGKSLISDTEIARLAGVTNQTLEGLGGEPTVNKKTTINAASDAEFPTSKAVATALALKVDKVAGKSLIDDTEIAKLATIDFEQEKTTPIDADSAGIWDSVLGKFVLTTWVNIKATLKTYFDTLYEKLANKQNSLTADGTGTKYPTVDAVNAALILKADSIDLVEAKQSISTLENVLSDANINQEAQVTTSGVDTVSLPKTAANTGMQVQLFGQSAENLVVNGDFRNGTTGWDIILPRESISMVGGKLRVSCVASDPNLTLNNTNTTNFILNNKYFVYMADAISTRNYNIYIRTSPSNTAYTIADKKSAVITTTNAGTNFNFQFQGVGNWLVGEYIDISHIKIINLTATFGAGNEPTKEQCDILFANYFEGSGNVLGTGRIRSVNSSGLLPSYLYFNGGKLRSNGLIKDEIRKGTNGYELVKRVGVGALGSELMQSPLNFTSGWTALANVTIVDSDTLTCTAAGNIYRNNVLPLNKFVRIKLSGTATTRIAINDGVNALISNVEIGDFNVEYYVYTLNRNQLYITSKGIGEITFTEFSVKEVSTLDGAGIGSASTANIAIIFGNNVHYTLDTTTITPIPHAGLLNSNSNGTVYFEPIIADAGVYSSNLAIQLTDYPINAFESIRKYANGTYTELNTATAVIASDGLSFTHPDLVSGDLVMFTYAYNRESIGRSMTLTHYDNRYVKVDTANGKTYRIDFVVTNGVVVPTATEV